jgi:metalloprotease
MLKFLPLLLGLLYALIAWRFSAWRTARELDARSTDLMEPGLSATFARLARAMDLPRIRVQLYDVPMVNGLADPQGRVFLTRGMIERYRAGDVTAEEIASVVAHELGHVALGHTRRRMIDFIGANTVGTALVITLSRLIPGVGWIIANLLTSLLVARISRGDEFAADAFASALLIKAGIGTGPQVTLFQKLDRLTGAASAGRPPAWLLSHPPAADRIAAIAANTAKWGAAEVS